MKGIKHMPKSYQQALTKQFDIIGKTKDMSSIDFKDDNKPFYRQYIWTEEEEQKFINWFTDKLINDKEFRSGILANKNKPRKKAAVAAAQEWNLLYGFATTIDD